ncbi:MAG: hypothetical protein E5W70_03590 [Mesorhizobium sp.]|uniref:hypothetical protein n=1 Tax=Mesorhizobium sp. TaxID=1871066 RepID=UPI001220BC8C|nr:hypothetical protein [Mesorhizobium sp.]TIT24402.1 MAG: hypothetical protein E5W70_03590 [Mesorhizobium sp.]
MKEAAISTITRRGILGGLVVAAALPVMASAAAPECPRERVRQAAAALAAAMTALHGSARVLIDHDTGVVAVMKDFGQGGAA